MPEQTSSTETTPSTTPAPDAAIKAELDQQMAISLNGGIPPAATAVSPASQEPAIPVDPFGVFKEKFGYTTPEAAVQDIEALRAFRAAPPTVELKFENETSKRVVEALQAGKLQEVYDVLDQQMRIDRLTGVEINGDSAAEIVKYGMQLRYKDLTPAEINYKFNKQFALPAKPALLPAEDQDEYNARVADWQAQIEDKKMELVIEAKTIRPDLLSAKSKLVFPTIASEQDASFQEWQKTVHDNDRLAAETTQAYKAFTPKSLETKINFKDEPNKIDFDFTHEPDPQSFTRAIDMVTDINKFWQSFIGPDGTPDRKAFATTLYFAMNKEKVILDVMNQTKNATIKAMLPDNSTGGLVRQLPQTQEPNELDQQMRIALKGYAGF